MTTQNFILKASKNNDKTLCLMLNIVLGELLCRFFSRRDTLAFKTIFKRSDNYKTSLKITGASVSAVSSMKVDDQNGNFWTAPLFLRVCRLLNVTGTVLSRVAD